MLKIMVLLPSWSTLCEGCGGTDTTKPIRNQVKVPMKPIQIITAAGLLISSLITVQAAPQLRLSDGTTTITVTDGDANDSSPDPGVVYYSGPVGSKWNVDVTIGVTKPANGTAGEPYMDLDTLNQSTSAADLTLQYTDTNFTSTSGTWEADFGGTTDGTVEFLYSMDPSNTPFGTNAITLADSPGNVSGYNGISNGTYNITAPYSITLTAKIHHTGRGTTGFDSQLTLTPPQQQPPTIQCAGDRDLGCNPASITSCDTNSITIITAGCGVSNITCAAAGPDIITGCIHERDLLYTVTDNCGQSATCTQHIYWTVDNTAPNFTKCPSDIDLGCLPSSIPDCDLSQVDATDDCGRVVFTCDKSDATNGCHITRTLTYVATDTCGNKATCTQHITWNTCTGSIGDFVWDDLNGNGCQDAGEPGITNVTVELYSGCSPSSLIATTTTDSTGHYLFTGLCPGDYSVKFYTPAGYTHTLAHQSCNVGGQPSTDTDSNCECTGAANCTVCVTLTSAHPDDLSIDCGYIKPASLGDYVWIDSNKNGIQDAGETGVNGVTVNLHLCSDNSVVATTTTANNAGTDGFYQFTGLTPGVGYYVEFVLPSGFTFTTANAPGSTTANDSNAGEAGNFGAGTTACVTLASGEYNPTIDAGLVCAGQIGDFVWNDSNANGCQDANEPGIPGVQVDLYAGCGVSGSPIASTTTDATGHYLFSGLCAGTYTVGFNTPAGYTRTIAHAGCANNANPPYSNQTDSKCDCAPGTPCGVCVTLTAANPINLNVDCGYVCNGQIGDFVWSDTNGNGCQDAGEPGIPGVQVNLYSGCGVSGSAIATTTTDATGHYLFGGLCPGTYTVSFITPAGYSRTIAHAGCSNNGNPPYSNQTDSKCDCAAGATCGVCVTLTAASPINLNIDCGYVNCQPCLQLIKTADQPFVAVGSSAGYSYFVTNCGCTTLTNVVVVDDNGTPNFDGDDFTVGTIASLPPGGSQTFHATVNLPVSLCVSNSPGTNAGTLIVTVLPSGDIQVDLRQARTLNDNVYGTPATADGWSSHKFSDLTGSDKAEFRFTDGNGKVVLDFFMDYISAATSAKFGDGVTVSYPSGYGTLGATGGDGSVVTGSASNILTCWSTLQKDLNQAPAFYGYIINSPTPESSFPTWDYVDGYSVVISKNAFGAAGFGGVTIPNIHNSPAKTGANQVTPVPCGGCITNTADAGINVNGVLAIMDSDEAVVCFGPQTPPGLKLIKDVDKSSITNGDTVTYTYTVQNTGSQTVTGITITDDNGTPADTSDDFVVGTIVSLAPLQSQTFSVSRTLSQPTQPVTMCETINGTNLTAGELYTTILPSGDIQVTYVQENVNDNRYGTGATATTGWANGHKFSDLTGSDEAEFRFTDKNGNVVVDAQLDYISAATSAKFGNGVTVLYPSGYGTLGPLGGDGKMIAGAASNVLSVTTSLTDDLNMPQFVSGYTVNSPTETSPNSGVSSPAGWNYKNTYTVVVRGSAFGAAGFGGVTIPQLHNSPPKTGSGPFTPTNCNPCIVNIASVTGTAIVNGTNVTLTASDSAQVCFGTSGGGGSSCNITEGKITLGTTKITVPIKNNGSTAIVLSEVDLTWPQVTNGKLKQIALNGVVWTGLANSPTTLTTADFNQTSTILGRRTIAAGQTKNLVLTFEHNVSTKAGDYSGGVAKFGADGSCQATFPAPAPLGPKTEPAPGPGPGPGPGPAPKP